MSARQVNLTISQKMGILHHNYSVLKCATCDKIIGLNRKATGESICMGIQCLDSFWSAQINKQQDLKEETPPQGPPTDVLSGKSNDLGKKSPKESIKMIPTSVLLHWAKKKSSV